MDNYNNNQANGTNGNTNGYNQQYHYGAYASDPYANYYYQQQYYSQQPPQQIPQGDPSAALSSMVYQLQQQTQQRQSAGAIAAASVSSLLGNRQQQQPQQADYYADYYSNQRSVINYDDLNAHNIAVAEPTAKIEDPNANKPKFCCNRWLKNAIAVAQHEKLHIQCPSCDHMCLKSALQEHEEIAHGKEKKESKKPFRPDGVIPANAPRIETPEELAAWIAARKKNWPSKDNIERKDKEEAEKIARGELPNKKRNNINNKRDQQNAKRQKLEEQQSSSLVAPYDSDSDNDQVDFEKDAISSKDPNSIGRILLPEENRPRKRCKYFAMGKCNKGDQCTFSHEKPEPKQPKPKTPRAAPAFKKRPNLLFKLLEKDIQQEKNVILQCLRYIVDNKFFGEVKDQDIAEAATQSIAPVTSSEIVKPLVEIVGIAPPAKTLDILADNTEDTQKSSLTPWADDEE